MYGIRVTVLFIVYANYAHKSALFQFFFFQAEDGIRDTDRSRGLGMCIRDRTTGVSAR